MPPSSTTGSVDFVRLGFDVSDAPAMVMTRPHRHDEIEITVLERGWNDYLFGGRRVRIPGGALCVRWAAIPHQSLAFDPGGTHYSLKVPLAWFLGWQLPESLVSRLLGGELLIDTRQDSESTDLALLRRWHRAFRSGSPPLHRMILLEAQARLLRLAVEFPPAQTPRGLTTVTGHLGRFEQMTVYIAGNYTRAIDVADVARAVGLHPNSAMRLFRQTCGLTILDYLSMHRVWHAQHLLASTDLKIRAIAEIAGFGSPNRFYAAFRRWVGQLPADYRAALQSQVS
ncbi:MAG: helix-turn-helix domain-containing protein [Planctomycetaceae bacterium]|jgi:AraC-like DNA-binding protein